MRCHLIVDSRRTHATTLLLTALLFLSHALHISAAPPPPTDAINPVIPSHEHHHEHDESGSAGHIHSIGTRVNVTLTPPDPHSHGSHTSPKVILDDEFIHLLHNFPPSYLAADFKLDKDSAIFGEEFDESWDVEKASGHRGLMVVHVLGMILAYFAALPISLALRAADHPSHYLANVVFLLTAFVGWSAGVAYKAATPNRYEGAVHNTFGNVLILLSVALAFLDSLGLIQRAIAFYRGPDRSWSEFIRDVLRSSTEEKWLDSPNRFEMVGFIEHDEQGNTTFSVGDQEYDERDPPPRTLAGSHRRPSLLIRQKTPPSRNSTGSEGTLNDSLESPDPLDMEYKVPLRSGAYNDHRENEAAWSEEPHKKLSKRRMLETFLTWVRRIQVVIAYVVVLTGITIYLGMCRAGFINTCAAHLVKGSIFFVYGCFTFSRYLGAYADLGWAWNRCPRPVRVPSAEMIECSIMFIYGITNTWMERFGSKPGDPYTVKQAQHISIAIMFWFVGLMGMFLESRRIRNILAAAMGRSGKVEEPPTYSFSFNPLPALGIAVTGLAMAAHHQDYVFQVAIHSLWGILLAGGSVFRFLTYFFLWLRPPIESILPSRPPTEVLTSFGWAAGGIVFMLSDEEVAFAAMRAGYDDVMAFLNVTIALTSLIFCWTLMVMAVKGFAVRRLQDKSSAERRESNNGDRI